MEVFAKFGLDPRSFFIYLGNMGVMLVLLIYFFYKPVLQYLDERREKISSSVREAENLKVEFAKRVEEMRLEKETTQKNLKEEIEHLKQYTEKKRSELLREMELERTRMIESTQAQLAEQSRQMMKDVEKRMKDVMKNILLDILSHKIPENVVQESIEESWQKFTHQA